MKIVRTSATTICPSLREELLKRKEDTFHNLQRNLRHPLGVYNLSLMNIWQTFEEVLDELDSVHEEPAFRQDPPDGRWDVKLLRRQEELISRVMRHFDDCLSLLCCFYPLSPNKSREADRQMVMKQPEVKAVMASIEIYRNYIANIMNHVKHYQGMLRSAVLFNDDINIIGYYVEQINDKGVIEPHPKVHSQFRGMHTGFSFNRNLRFIFWLIYAVSDLASSVIQKIHPKTVNVQISENLENQSLRIAKRLVKLPKYLFDDEQYMDFPEIVVTENANLIELCLEYPSTTTILPTLYGKPQMLLGWVEDGVTVSYQRLYYNTPSEGKIYRQKTNIE